MHRDAFCCSSFTCVSRNRLSRPPAATDVVHRANLALSRMDRISVAGTDQEVDNLGFEGSLRRSTLYS